MERLAARVSRYLVDFGWVRDPFAALRMTDGRIPS